MEFVRHDGPEPGRWTGLAAGGAFRDFLSAWEDLRIKTDEYRELDDERVLVLAQLTGRGKTSGVELGQVGTQGARLFHLRGGKVTTSSSTSTASARSPTSGSRRRATPPIGATEQASARDPQLRKVDRNDRPR